MEASGAEAVGGGVVCSGEAGRPFREASVAWETGGERMGMEVG